MRLAREYFPHIGTSLSPVKNGNIQAYARCLRSPGAGGSLSWRGFISYSTDLQKKLLVSGKRGCTPRENYRNFITIRQLHLLLLGVSCVLTFFGCKRTIHKSVWFISLRYSHFPLCHVKCWPLLMMYMWSDSETFVLW